MVRAVDGGGIESVKFEPNLGGSSLALMPLRADDSRIAGPIRILCLVILFLGRSGPRQKRATATPPRRTRVASEPNDLQGGLDGLLAQP